jgi:hypothetical protein
MSDATQQELRHTFRPYIGLVVIFGGVLLFLVFVMYKTHDWDWKFGLEAVGMMAFFIFLFVYLGSRYRILWDDTGVTMRASGGPPRRFTYSEIHDIRYEVEVSQSRPMRRIVLYKAHRPHKEWIDISLKHFPLDQINQLLADIHTHRPDLSVPTISTNGTVTFPNQPPITPYSYRGGPD